MPVPSPAPEPDPKARLQRLFVEHYRPIWRFVRRLGLPEAQADDASQQVFVVAAERLADIALPSERAFLFATALRIATTMRRKNGREPATDETDLRVSALPGQDELADQKRAREVLDGVLSRMPLDLRTALLLFEIEGLTLREIAEVVGVPQGTAASRLRRARELFRAEVEARFVADAKGGAA